VRGSPCATPVPAFGHAAAEAVAPPGLRTSLANGRGTGILPGSMFKRIAHVCLNVKNLERSLEFYTRLGCEPVFRFTRKGGLFGVYLRLAPSSFIEIFEDSTLATPPVNSGLAHFCLETEDLDGLLAELGSRGIAASDKKLGCDATWQIWLADPDGNRFEVHEYTKQSMQRTGGTVEADW
jgi:lactoylglutathione lyase